MSTAQPILKVTRNGHNITRVWDAQNHQNIDSASPGGRSIVHTGAIADGQTKIRVG